MATRPNRRDFLVRGSAALAVLAGCGRDKAPPPDAMSRLHVGVVGVGGFSGYHLDYWLASPRVDVIGLADPESIRLDAAVARTGAQGYRDYRELLARDDLDAVINVTPDHWHARISIDAANAGKHVYCEKPLTLTVDEGRKMVEAARANAIAFQTGSQQRSAEEFHRACEIVRNGKLGRVARVEVRLAPGPFIGPTPAEPQPATFDWNLWTGPAPLSPFHQLRSSGTFRFFRDYSYGTITDLGAHMLDIAQWGLDRDGSGPSTVVGTGTFAAGNFYESPTEFDVRFTYDDGIELHLTSSTESFSTTFIGEAGELYVERGRLEASRPELLEYELGSGTVVLPTSRDHYANWLDAIVDGGMPICDVEIGHRSATLCHLAGIAIETGRTLTWDPVTERFAGDEAANALLSRPVRTDWE